MEEKVYTVVGRINGWRAVQVKAKNSSEAMKIARKLPAEKWAIGDIHIWNDLSARRANNDSDTVKDKLKKIVIDKMLNENCE